MRSNPFEYQSHDPKKESFFLEKYGRFQEICRCWLDSDFGNRNNYWINRSEKFITHSAVSKYKCSYRIYLFHGEALLTYIFSPIAVCIVRDVQELIRYVVVLYRLSFHYFRFFFFIRFRHGGVFQIPLSIQHVRFFLPLFKLSLIHI